MKIKVGNLDVLDSGSVIGNYLQPIEFSIDKSSNFIVRMEFTLAVMGYSRTPKVEASQYGSNGVSLIFQNFAASKGHGNADPIELGIFQGRRLYLNYRIHSFIKEHPTIPNGGVLLNYTWLLGESVR